jgi:hypothetical protein
MSTKTITIREAKTHLSNVVDDVGSKLQLGGFNAAQPEQ